MKADAVSGLHGVSCLQIFVLSVNIHVVDINKFNLCYSKRVCVCVCAWWDVVGSWDDRHYKSKCSRFVPTAAYPPACSLCVAAAVCVHTKVQVHCGFHAQQSRFLHVRCCPSAAHIQPEAFCYITVVFLQTHSRSSLQRASPSSPPQLLLSVLGGRGTRSAYKPAHPARLFSV